MAGLISFGFVFGTAFVMGYSSFGRTDKPPGVSAGGEAAGGRRGHAGSQPDAYSSRRGKQPSLLPMLSLNEHRNEGRRRCLNSASIVACSSVTT